MKEEYLIEKEKSPNFYFSVRFLMTCLIFCGVAIQYTQKIDISIGIVCMVNNTVEPEPKETSSNTFLRQIKDSNDVNDTCLFKPKNGTNNDETDGPFTWSKKTQGFILSSYFYGYIILQIPSGWLASKIGGQKVLGASMFLGSLMTLLVPVSANWGYEALIACRFLNGLVHGAVWPAISSLYVPWSPPMEKSRLIGFSTAGTWIGNVVALPVGSYLCTNGFDGGWPSIFYTFGTIGLIWSVIFLFLTSDSPKTHRFISKAEREYVAEKTLSITEAISETPNAPWLLIFKSKSCIALFVSHFCCNWANYLFLTQLPSFMNDILRFDIKSNGLLSTLPYIATWTIATISAIVSDKIIASNLLTRNNVRKLFNTSGFAIGIIATLCLSFVTCSNPYLAIVLLTIGIGSFGMCTGAGFIVNINEVGGLHAGVLCGISNSIATLPGIIAPYIVGIITSNKLQSEWKIIFIISCFVYFIGGSAFLIFSQCEPFYQCTEQKNKEIDEDITVN